MPLQEGTVPQQPQASDQVISSSPPAQQLLAPNTATSLQHVKRIIIGIGWDVGAGAFAGSGSAEVDLDASLTCFDAMGQYVDCIYFGNLVNANKSIQHTGDNKTGVGEGNDEEIIMQLDQIPPPTCICVLTINSYSGDTFANVNRAFVKVSNADRPGRELEMGTFSLSSAGPYTAMIMGKFYRSPADGTWIFHTIGLGAQGRSFGEILPSMQNQLKDLIPNIVIQPNPNIIIMTKGEAVAIVSKDQNVPLNQITLGLGWDQMGDNPIDLDASCCLFSDTNQHVDSVYFNHLQSNDGAIRHAGDNRSGAGDGDDEKVYVDLSRLSRNITSLFFIVNSYSGHQFSRIKNAYIRILESHNPRGMEIMRFSLSTAQGPALSATAMIMCKLYRHPRTGQWMCKSLGYPTQGRTWNENIHEMQKELTGRLPQIDGFRFDPRAAQQQPQRQPQQQQQQQRPAQGVPPKNTNACCIIS